MQSLPIHKIWMLCLLVIVVALSIATPVLADYLGPNRTVTVTTGGACKIVLNECQYVPEKKDYRYKNIEDWVCANESKPWQAYPNEEPRPCSAKAVGDQYWSREQGTQQVTTTYPPATIDGSLQGCTLQNGWCGATTPQLSLNANEPVDGYSIVLIEGIFNGQPFACTTANCSVPLNEGDNSFSFWALSSFGDSSFMGTSSARVDTVSPDVSLNISGANGENGWYISPTTVSALGSDSTSGLASALLSVNGETWQPSTTLGDGVHSIVVTASDNAGNVSSASTTLSVDTTTPSVNVSINGVTGRNGWYRSSIQVSALSRDAVSGLRSFEVSTDGGGYQTYRSVLSFPDGHHTIRFKAVDNAGNITETALQEFYIDTIAPSIELPSSWELGRNVPYNAQDAGSGLAALRIVIEDEDERYAKLAWDETVSGAIYAQDINWNGQFRDKTQAPPGMYLVWIKASDQAGNEQIKLGKVMVPEANGLFALFSQDAPAETPLPPDDLSPEEIPTDMAIPPALDFGGSATPTKETATQSLLLTTGTAGSIPLASTNVLWGAAAAAAIGAATAYVLDERRKREEEIERQAREAVQELENDAKKRETKLQKQQENWLKQQSLEQLETQQDFSIPMERRVGLLEMEETKEWAREQALRHRDPALTASRTAKIERMEIEDGIPWIMKEVEHEWQEIADGLQAKADIYRATTWQKDQDAAPRPEPNWWEKTKAYIDEKIVQPLSNPPAGSFGGRLNQLEASETASLREFLYQDAFQSAAERTKTFIASETADIKKALDPALEKHRQFVANELDEIKKRFYEPLLQPVVQKIAKDITDDFRLLNSQVYQPYIQPLVASTNEKFYQPHVRPVIDSANDWVNRNIYYPVFAPVEEDVQEYIGQPASKWWKQYGEWVHGALDAAGFIPGFGDVADFINGVIYLTEGRKLEATLSLVSGIPVIGYFGAPGKAILEAGQGAFDKVVKTTVESFGVNFVEMGEKQLVQEGVEKLVKETGTPLVTSELVEQAIQLAGSIPGVGNVTTSLTSLIQLGKGRTLDAFMSAFSMVPIAGGIAATLKRTIDESLQRIVFKQAKEEAVQKLAKELAEFGSEKLAKETGEVIAEKVAKEAGEDLMVKSIKETGEEITEGVAKESLEEGAEHLSKEVVEASVAKTTKETFEETAESAIERAKCKMREDSFVEKVTEKDSETETKRDVDQPVLEKSNQVTQEREHKVLSTELKSKYDNLIEKHGKAASDAFDVLSPEHANKLLTTLDADSLDRAIQDGPEAVVVLAGWSERELQQHGAELAVRAKRDSVALGAVRELVESGPINPEKLTDQQRALIEKIAEYSTQNGDQKQGVLGKWFDISSGFVKYAQDTNSLHYNPHPDMWKMLGSLGPAQQAEVAWLINRQVIQTGVSKGLLFEYTLNGVSVKDVPQETNAVEAIFSGKTQEDIKRILKLDYVPIRMQELIELQKAGYEFTFDDVANTYILIKP